MRIRRALSGLLSEGFRKVVALVDTSFGGEEPPGLYAGTEDDNPEHCSQDSLGIVGEVTVEALDRIGERKQTPLRALPEVIEVVAEGAEQRVDIELDVVAVKAALQRTR